MRKINSYLLWLKVLSSWQHNGEKISIRVHPNEQETPQSGTIKLTEINWTTKLISTNKSKPNSYLEMKEEGKQVFFCF